MEHYHYKFSTFFWRVYASHVVTYFIMGIIASSMLNYKEVFDSSCYFKPYDSPWIAGGVALQVFRGLIFALALWYFKESFLHQKYGWIKLWGLLVGLSILSTTAAATGSIEGFIYTNVPIGDQIIGYIEVVPQVGVFSFLLCRWYDKPKKYWDIISGILVALIMFMSLMGVLAATGTIQVD